MTSLTTHILDTSKGKPAAGVLVRLYAQGDPARLLVETRTDTNGRADCAPSGGTLSAGVYDLVFSAGDYFAEQGFESGATRFLDEIVLRFGIAADAQHYHVPLLVSPWSYTTYRGS